MNNGGLDHQEVGVGNSKGRSGRLATAGDTSTELSSLTLLVSRQEPPYTEPYVRWCERTAGVNPPPTRSREVISRSKDWLTIFSPTNDWVDLRLATSNKVRLSRTKSVPLLNLD